MREVPCSQVCGAHGTDVANAVTCVCSCRDGFGGPRCERYLGWLAGLFSPRGLAAGTTSPHPESQSQAVAEPDPENLPELPVEGVAEPGGTVAVPGRLPEPTVKTAALADTALNSSNDTRDE